MSQHRTPALLRALRPKQWVKNVLVVAAPLAAGEIFDVSVLTDAAIAFVAFCVAASGAYLLNDVRDVAVDRAHPTKRHRPVAAGELRPGTAVAVGVVLLVLAPLVALLASGALALVVVSYEVLTVSYSFGLKRVATVEMGAVAAGFALRAAAGGAAAGVPLSEWFVVVSCFGALALVADKRFAELVVANEQGGPRRAVLEHYTVPFLNHVRTLASTLAVAAYCQWSFARGVAPGAAAFQLSAVPFVLALLHYGLAASRGEGGAPEDLLLGDRTIMVLGVAFVALFTAGLLGW